MKKTTLWVIIALLVLIIGTGGIYLWQAGLPANEETGDVSSINGVVQDDSGKVVQYWYDPMMPDHKFDKPGKSPFMDMQLVPKYASDNGQQNSGDSGVSIPSGTVQNLGIRMATVSRESLDGGFAAVGRVEADERATYAVQTRVPGFVERLLVRAVGEPVSRNQKVAEVYAPELLAAQNEYLALLDIQQVGSLDDLKTAARTRLKLLGMSDGEISRIAKSGQSSPRVGIYAPASGIVADLGVREGAQLMTGSTLMQIADLSKVWVIAEVPERDADRVEIGMPVTVELPGANRVSGKVAYIYPTLDEAARVLRVRIELPNPEGSLRPGMYANVNFKHETGEVLTVPSESIIATGRRKVVIVKDENGYRPAEVRTGQASNGRTEILAGLNEGEQVVVSGQFLIDSEASLSGVLTRLSQQQADPHAGHDMSQLEASTQGISGTGTVKSIDAQSAEITLAHDPIPAIEWPSMTMGFKVDDAQQLQGLRQGDVVEFSLKLNEPSDEYVISRIRKHTDAADEAESDAHMHHDHGAMP